jgi:hypothetical protein
MRAPTDPISELRWLSCVNASSVNTIPAFGVVRETACDVAGVLTVDQPNADSQEVLVNGPVPIPPSGKGLVTWDAPLFVIYDNGDGTPADEEGWGPGNGSYKLRKGGAGFVCVDSASATNAGPDPEHTSIVAANHRAYFRRQRGPLLGKLDGTLSAGSSATMSIWDGASDTGANVTVYNWFGTDVASGKKVMAAWFPGAGKWYVVAADC